MEDHAYGQLKYFGRLGQFGEDPVERAHKLNKTIRSICSGVRNEDQRDTLIQKRSSIHMDMKIKNTSNKVLALTKRKFNQVKILSTENKIERKKQIKIERYKDVTKNINNTTNITTV